MGRQGAQVILAQDPDSLAEGLAVGLERLPEPPQATVVRSQVVFDVEGPIVMGSENTLELRKQALVELQCLGELAVRAQVGAAGVGAQQGPLVLVAVAIL